MRPLRPSLAGAAVLAAALAAGSASAANWTLTGTAFERVEANSNLELQPDGEPVFGSITGAEFELGYDARHTQAFLATGLDLRGYVGPGDTEELDGFSSPRLAGGVQHRDARRTIGADFNLVRQQVAFSQLDQFELIREDATETRLDLGTDWSWLVSPRTTVSLGTNATLRRFSEESAELTPSTTIALTSGFSRKLDPLTEGGLTFVYRNFRSDGVVEDVQTDALTLLLDGSRRLTARHTLGASAGVGHAWTDRDPIFPGADESDSGFVFEGSLDFTWTGPGQTAIALSAEQSLEPSAEGTLASTTRIGATFSRPLTARTGLSVDASYARRNSGEAVTGDGDSGSQLLQAGAGLDFRLTRVWSAATGLRLRWLDDEDGSAHSESLFFEIRRPLVLLR